MLKAQVIDGDRSRASALRRRLQAHGLMVDVFFDANAGLDALLVSRYAVAIIDLAAPGCSGDDLPDRVSAAGSVPVLIIRRIGRKFEVVARVGTPETGHDSTLVPLAGVIARAVTVARRSGRSPSDPS